MLRRTHKEELIEALDELRQVSIGDPYKEALHAVLFQLAGMTCEAATYDAIAYYDDEPGQIDGR